MFRLFSLYSIFFSTCFLSLTARGQVFPLGDSVVKYYEKGKSLEFANQWLDAIRKAKKNGSLEEEIAEVYKARALDGINKIKEADSILTAAIKKLEKRPGTDAIVGRAYQYLGEVKITLYQGDTGIEMLNKAIHLLTKSVGEVQPLVIDAHLALASNYEYREYEKTKDHYRKAVSLQIRLKGPINYSLTRIYHMFGVFWRKTGQTDSSKIYLTKALEIHKKLYGDNSLQVGSAYAPIAATYDAEGKYAAADSLYQKSIQIVAAAGGPKSKALARTYYSYAHFCSSRDELAKSEKAYLRMLDIYMQFPEAERDYLLIFALNNISTVYLRMGDQKNAEHYIKECLKERLKVYGPDQPPVGMSHGHLGSFYYRQGKYHLSEENYRKQLTIYSAQYGAQEYLPTKALIDIAIVNIGKGYLARADSMLRVSYTNFTNPKISKFVEQSGWVEYHNALGGIYYNTGNMQEALNAELKQYSTLVKGYGKESLKLGGTLNSLARIYEVLENYPEAESYYLKSVHQVKEKVSHSFPFLSEYQKSVYWGNQQSYLENFTSFCIRRQPQRPNLLDHLYDSRLFTKSLLLNSSAKWKQRIKASQDKKLHRLYDSWEEYQAKLMKLEQSTDSVARAGIDSLQTKAEKLEKELSARSEHFATLADKKQYSWRDVQKTLKPGEAVVEMIRLSKFGVEKTLTDSSDPKRPVYRVKGLTDTIHYAALVVKPGMNHPELVLFTNGNELEKKDVEYYRNCIQRKIKDDQSYKKFWKKISDKLGPVTRKIYFSPDGIYHSINLQTLFNPASKKYLIEEQDIRMVTTTKDLVIPRKEEELNQLAYLIGYPDYNQNLQAMNSSKQRSAGPNLTYKLGTDASEAYGELPGTKSEVEGIAGILRGKGWEVQTLTGSGALEEALKESFKPRVLHIATHGYFKSDSTEGYNPLVRSGLLLTGANQTLRGIENERGDDGILTAYEAMNLNLDNTDLVVLSACETGLGEIKNGEGVYGLQRAFKVAGAKSIIMSLWKVDDEATQELMVSFYKHWLTASTSKRSAFLAAQKELKAKYPNPYYWGAFVMVGE